MLRKQALRTAMERWAERAAYLSFVVSKLDAAIAHLEQAGGDSAEGGGVAGDGGVVPSGKLQEQLAVMKASSERETRQKKLVHSYIEDQLHRMHLDIDHRTRKLEHERRRVLELDE